MVAFVEGGDRSVSPGPDGERVGVVRQNPHSAQICRPSFPSGRIGPVRSRGVADPALRAGAVAPQPASGAFGAGSWRPAMNTLVGLRSLSAVVVGPVLNPPSRPTSLGEIPSLVLDEWPDEQSFRSLSEENSQRIGPLMQAVGVTAQPQPKLWRKLDTHDEYGWGA